jgi:hypothetical protein
MGFDLFCISGAACGFRVVLNRPDRPPECASLCLILRHSLMHTRLDIERLTHLVLFPFYVSEHAATVSREYTAAMDSLRTSIFRKEKIKGQSCLGEAKRLLCSHPFSEA